MSEYVYRLRDQNGRVLFTSEESEGRALQAGCSHDRIADEDLDDEAMICPDCGRIVA